MLTCTARSLSHRSRLRGWLHWTFELFPPCTLIIDDEIPSPCKKVVAPLWLRYVASVITIPRSDTKLYQLLAVFLPACSNRVFT